MYLYVKVWGILLACLQTVVPTVALLILGVDIFLRLRQQQKQKRRLNQGRRERFVDRQMLVIMLTSIFIFFSNQIPLSLFNILISPVLRLKLTITQAYELESIVRLVASITYTVRKH